MGRALTQNHSRVDLGIAVAQPDGAVGAAFLTDFTKMVEDPYTVLL